MNINFSVCLLVSFCLLFMGCKSNKSLSSNNFQNEYFGIKNFKCDIVQSPNAIDSKVGTIKCENVTFGYDYGKYSYPGPLTTIEEFKNSFDSYYHIKFFEDRMIDKKVYKLFLDSVKVIDVRAKKDDDKLMYACDPCNTTAELTFMGDTYLFPTTMGENQFNNDNFTVDYKKEGKFIYKYYKMNNGKPGLFAEEIDNRYNTKDCLSLSVIESNLSDEQIEEILRSVYLK